MSSTIHLQPKMRSNKQVFLHAGFAWLSALSPAIIARKAKSEQFDVMPL